ncbi:sortase-dependent protein [Streptomyces sp. NPDC005574]|uniref:sortase-dependent protein n=1 Tax=Streptomyces sp. NPDC005574 TaxID=3156891 RepID=UPI0033A8DA97
MSRHLTLRLAVLTAVAAGALVVPASAAFADDPSAAPSASDTRRPTAAEKAAADKRKAEAAKKATDSKTLSPEERKRQAAAKAGAGAPRGGVAAGEAPADDSSVVPLAGSATGALLLAGAGTFVLRRRSAGRRNG